MSFKTLLVHIGDDDAGRARVRAAADLAQAFDARLIGLAAAAQPAPVVAEGSAFAAGVWAEQAASHEAAAQKAADAFAAEMERRGLPFETRVIAGFEDTAGAALAVSGRYADLIVIGGRDGMDSRALADSLIDGALFETGSPVLVLPAAGMGATLGKRPLIAWDGGPLAARSAHDALPFIATATEVRVAVARTYFGMARHGEEPGADVARWLSSHGAKVSVEVLDPGGRSVPEALTEAARRAACDMIVMGAFGHSRLREALFGGVTSDMLNAPPLPLFMAH
jgi:nucleotide-binding universal stress UspA family protein